MPTQKNKNADSKIFKVWISTTLSLIGVVVASIFWIQNHGESKYYSKISGMKIEDEISELKNDIEIIREQNNEIIRSLGIIEGKLSTIE